MSKKFLDENGLKEVATQVKNLVGEREPTIDLTKNKAVVSNSNGKLATSNTTDTEIGYLSGTTSNVQTQLNSKQSTITGGATTITSNNLTKDKALISDTNGKVATSNTTSTEIGYLSGVTSNVQTQLNSKQATLTSAQQNAVNSGITSSLVNQIGTNKTNIATNTSNIATNTTDISTINSKIPTQASSTNQLADKNFVNSSINNVAAYYITRNANGDAFETYAQLSSATTFYSGGAVRTPTRNDYCIVRADETHDSATTRYIYQGTQWEYQYTVSDKPLTADQLSAINSGITADLVAKLNGIETGANKTVVTQDTGTSTTSVMSQKAVTDGLATKVNTSDTTVVRTNTDQTISGIKTFSDHIKTPQVASTEGKGLVRYKSTEGKSVFGNDSTENVLMGDTTRPYYSSSGSDFTGVEIALKSDVDTETTARETADSTLQTNIDKKIGAGNVKAGANITITTSGNDITINAVAEEGGSVVNINGTKAPIVDFDSDPQTQLDTNATAIATETTNRTSADSNLQTQITANKNNLASEVTDRTNADTNLQSQITTNANNITSLSSTVSGHTTSINSLETEVDTNTTNIATNTSDISSLKTSKLDVSKANTNVVTELGLTATNDNVTLNKSYKNLSTQATSSKSTTVPLANDTTAGLMSKADYAQIRENTSRIEQLEGQNVRLLYTASNSPTAAQIQAFVKAEGYTDTTQWVQIGVVVSGTNHIWRYYSNTSAWTDIGIDTVNQFTNSIAGIIKGSATAGKVYAETDGTGSVYGWDALNTSVSNNASAISAETTARTNADSTLQTNINKKQDTITGGATTITSSNLTTNRALISNASGKVAVSEITSTELGYLDGVTSNVQTQLDNALPSTTSSLTLSVAGWSSKTQTVTISGYDSSKLNTIVPDLASAVTWANCGINASAESSTGITFTCAVTPTVALTFKVVSEKLNS